LTSGRRTSSAAASAQMPRSAMIALKDIVRVRQRREFEARND